MDTVISVTDRTGGRVTRTDGLSTRCTLSSFRRGDWVTTLVTRLSVTQADRDTALGGFDDVFRAVGVCTDLALRSMLRTQCFLTRLPVTCRHMGHTQDVTAS